MTQTTYENRCPCGAEATQLDAADTSICDGCAEMLHQEEKDSKSLPYFHPAFSNIPLNIEIMKDDFGNPYGQLPTRSNSTDAGLDLYSAEDVIIQPNLYPAVTNMSDAEDNHRVIVDLGIKMEFPPGLAFFIHDRSGMSAKSGIHRVAGIVDSAYRGQVKVALVNLSSKVYHIKKGDRIAQGVLAPVILATPVEVATVSDSVRGESGFGSTGT